MVRSRLFVYAGTLATTIAFVGFWPTYFGPLFAGTLSTSSLIHIHAGVQVIWLALFMAQVSLVAAGRISQHVKLGAWVAAFGIVVILAGLVLSFEIFANEIAAGEQLRGQRRLFGFLRDLVFFAPFLVAGWICRRRADLHKRLMLTAATILLLPAVGRMSFLGPAPLPVWIFMLVWPLPIYLAMLHDYVMRRVVHPVYVIGVLAMLAMRLVLPLRTSGLWLAISGWFAGFYTA